MWTNLTKRIWFEELIPHLSFQEATDSWSGPIAVMSGTDAPWQGRSIGCCSSAMFARIVKDN